MGAYQCYDEEEKEGEEEVVVEEQRRKKEKGRRKKKKKKEEEEKKCSGSVKAEAAEAKRQRQGLRHLEPKQEAFHKMRGHGLLLPLPPSIEIERVRQRVEGFGEGLWGVSIPSSNMYTCISNRTTLHLDSC
ncbi:hypothetical protein B296_00004652 [Ensete ventricosum]|uniref:Uncharacterized protein n=1 Tax=Ensete ventricosum TaxID=4639 RepID=A0A427ARW4_ENSVE|nr:hypothetical protein B296_00004652 [Ensete ventricosum]